MVLYEALTGVKPFTGGTAMAVATAIATMPTPSLEPAGAGAGLDPQMIAAVERAMAKDPAQRPATAAEMALDLGLGAPAPSALAPDPTVALAAGPPAGGADPTLVSAPGSKMGASGVDERAGRRRPVPIPGSLAAGRRFVPALLAAAAVLLFVVLIAMAGGGGGGGGTADQEALSGRLSALAERVEVGDGAKGAEAAERLREVADQVKAGGGGDAATELLGDAAGWNASGQLFRTAYAEMVALLRLVPGVDATAGTTAPTAPATTTAPPTSEEEGDEDGKGKGKGRGRGDD